MNPTRENKYSKKKTERTQSPKAAKTCRGYRTFGIWAERCLHELRLVTWVGFGAEEIDWMRCRKLRCGMMSVDLIDCGTMVTTEHAYTYSRAITKVVCELPLALARRRCRKVRVKQILTINFPFTLSVPSLCFLPPSAVNTFTLSMCLSLSFFSIEKRFPTSRHVRHHSIRFVRVGWWLECV